MVGPKDGFQMIDIVVVVGVVEMGILSQSPIRCSKLVFRKPIYARVFSSLNGWLLLDA